MKILRALTGSRCYGTNREDSDYDWKSVFIQPTSDILRVNGGPKRTNHSQVGEEDEVSYELSHFLHLSVQCNPAVLEVYFSPQYSVLELDGVRLIEMFEHIWSSDRVMAAFRGYAMSERGKFEQSALKGNVDWKKGACWIRNLWLAGTLLETHSIPLPLPESVRDTLVSIGAGELKVTKVISLGRRLENQLESIYERVPKKEADIERVDDFLLSIRRRYWN